MLPHKDLQDTKRILLSSDSSPKSGAPFKKKKDLTSQELSLSLRYDRFEKVASISPSTIPQIVVLPQARTAFAQSDRSVSQTALSSLQGLKYLYLRYLST